jgi:hypothetical protein
MWSPAPQPFCGGSLGDVWQGQSEIATFADLEIVVLHRAPISRALCKVASRITVLKPSEALAGHESPLR